MECGFGRVVDRPRPLPLAVTAFRGPERDGEDPLGAVFSFQVKKEDEGRLPSPDPPVLPCFTSRSGCAPKLERTKDARMAKLSSPGDGVSLASADASDDLDLKCSPDRDRRRSLIKTMGLTTVVYLENGKYVGYLSSVKRRRPIVLVCTL